MTFNTLPPGALIGVIAPAGPAQPEALAAVPALYESFGYRARIFPGCTHSTGYLAGDDSVRLADLHAALADDELAAIHCMRGGYGAMRLLDRIDTTLLRAHPKLLIGYSDITALHALWALHGLPSLHAPMATSDLIRPGHETDAQALFALLQDGLRAGTVLAPTLLPSDPNSPRLCVPGSVRGRLIGGNLSLVACLLGTPWAWQTQGAVLFLEDVSEELYRVDRLLTQLRLAGVLGAVAGFVLGSFTESESPDALLREFLLPLGKPVLGGWPSGHGTPNLPLPMGVMVEMDAQAGTLKVLEDFIR
jgi:muramoyltetrapeptide carboxypeptidase